MAKEEGRKEKRGCLDIQSKRLTQFVIAGFVKWRWPRAKKYKESLEAGGKKTLSQQPGRRQGPQSSNCTDWIQPTTWMSPAAGSFSEPSDRSPSLLPSWFQHSETISKESSWARLDFRFKPLLLWLFVTQQRKTNTFTYSLQNTSLPSSTTRHSRFILYFPCPDPRINYFFKESWFLLLENGIYKPRSVPYVCSLLMGQHCV